MSVAPPTRSWLVAVVPAIATYGLVPVMKLNELEPPNAPLLLNCTFVLAPPGEPPAVAAMVMLLAPWVTVMLAPAVMVLYSSPVAAALTPSTWLAVPMAVSPVPPVAVVCVVTPDVTRPKASVVTVA